MENVKEYKFMTPEEQLKWLTDFSAFSNEKLPALCAIGDAWESNAIKDMERGLVLISAFGYCRDFVEKSLLFRDFSRRIHRLQYYVERIKEEISKGNAVKGSRGETLACVPPLQPTSRRRGRPTKEAAAAASVKKQQHEMAEQKSALIDGIVNGQPSVTSGNEAAMPKQKDLFSSVVDMSLGDVRLHLDQLEWMMSEELRQEVKQISGLRATAAKESNMAKEMSERGVEPSVIEPHAQAAIQATNEYKAIYRKVDMELGRLCAAVKACTGVPVFVLEYMHRHGIDKDDVIRVTTPYWEKIGSPDFESVKDATDVVPEDDSSDDDAKQRASRLHVIRVYMMRKDMKITENRLEKMRAYIEEVRSIGEDTSEYEAILSKAEKDFQSAGKEQ